MNIGFRVIALAVASIALPPRISAAAEPAAEVTDRPGQHDFDFNFGTWQTHVRRLLKPLTGSANWAEYNGTSTVTKVWDGRASLLELVVDGPSGRIEGLGLRLYSADGGKTWETYWKMTDIFIAAATNGQVSAKTDR